MAKINWRQVVLGGFLWVIAFNVMWLSAWFLFLRTEWLSEFAALGRTWPEAYSSLALWLVLTFVGGVFAIWLYAAIRPHYGPGPKTAAYAGFALWLISGLGPTVWSGHILALPTGLVMSTVATGLVADVVATVLAAWPYKET